MAASFKVLGQSTSLTGNTNVLIYGVPYYTSTVVSSLNICNTGNGPATFDIAFRRFGANLTAQHYFAYRTPIALNESISIAAGITLDQSDLVSISANTANVSFSLFGSESTTQGFTIFPVIEYLLVGGGGGSSGTRSGVGINGGGGGGGFITGSFSSPQTGGTIYTITVGAGGAVAGNGGNTSIAGSYVPISTITAHGGGKGALNSAGSAGGSGGGGNPGGAGNTPPAPAGFAIQGYGGVVGGGGAGNTAATSGGAGRYSSLAAAGGFYAYYGGGGAGSTGSYASAGDGGIGGGGASQGPTLFYGGSIGTSGAPGSTYGSYSGQSGYGGGGGSMDGGVGTGGSGVVIVRYASDFPAANALQGASVLTPTISAGYRYYKWTSSGTFTF